MLRKPKAQPIRATAGVGRRFQRIFPIARPALFDRRLRHTEAEQQQVAKVLEHDAEVVSNTQLEKQLAGQPQKTQDEIIRINTQARHIALQVALLIPILAGLIGLLISFRMMRLPDPRQSGSGEQAVLG